MSESITSVIDVPSASALAAIAIADQAQAKLRDSTPLAMAIACLNEHAMAIRDGRVKDKTYTARDAVRDAAMFIVAGMYGDSSDKAKVRKPHVRSGKFAATAFGNALRVVFGKKCLDATMADHKAKGALTRAQLGAFHGPQSLTGKMGKRVVTESTTGLALALSALASLQADALTAIADRELLPTADKRHLKPAEASAERTSLAVAIASAQLWLESVLPVFDLVLGAIARTTNDTIPIGKTPTATVKAVVWVTTNRTINGQKAADGME